MGLRNTYSLFGFEGGKRENMKVPSGVTSEKVGPTRGKYYVTFRLGWGCKISGIDRCF